MEPRLLPRAIVRTTEASETATRWVLRLTWLMLMGFVVLCAIGYLPKG